MDYEKLFTELRGNPPNGWCILHHANGEQGGVYLWPSDTQPILNAPRIVEDQRLLNHSILFEFHVTPPNGNHARILARARFQGAQPEGDPRWVRWRDFAIEHCRATRVGNQGEAKITKSVAMWDGGSLGAIKFDTDAVQAAAQIRAFLSKPPTSMRCFIVHLTP